MAPPVKRSLAPAARLQVHAVTASGPSASSLDMPPVITAADVVSVSAADLSGKTVGVSTICSPITNNFVISTRSQAPERDAVFDLPTR